MARGTEIASSNPNAGNSTSTAGILFDTGSKSNEAWIVVGDEPVRLEAFNMQAGATLTFERVIYKSGTAESLSGCCVKPMIAGQVRARRPYKLCDCTPTLSADNGEMWIYRSGLYAATLRPAEAVGVALITSVRDACAPEATSGTQGCCPSAPPAPPGTIDLFTTTTMPNGAPAYLSTANIAITVGNYGTATANNPLLTGAVLLTSDAHWPVEPIAITYSGGATGPSSALWADLLSSGIAITSIPAGGTATLSSPFNFGSPNSITVDALISVTGGQTDTNAGNNSSSLTVAPII
jgi:hypothetical protein